MPATCDRCGRRELVYVCPDCRKAVRAEAQPKQKRGARHCKPCRAQWKQGHWELPYAHCAECLRGKGIEIA